ncbi:AbrB family transcriptional regulator [Paenibacillus sp. N3.4]|uniref:AbrB family transcriptional regulator n=1 Tax=Paenibacillus sp. N3.4 TaxID=2603222 RepID=UPI0011CB67A1|nr:AbrB family transcriptional regulator [Paenibacillus sp. N3.4]TXK73514.1 AbrB family transcriptional regulator [Paenibacillus sp. N3.4]
MSSIAKFLITVFIAMIGGYLFAWMHMPIPWLLGPMISVLLASKWGKLSLTWPSYLRDTGILIVGYSIGLSLTKAAFIEISHQLPSMLLMTVALITLCAVVAYVISKVTGVSFPTMMTASIPGGLSQMITLAEEFKNIDITLVTFFQVIRLMMIVFIVPLLVFSPLLGELASETTVGVVAPVHPSTGLWSNLFPNIWIYAIVCVCFAWIGKKIKLPTAYMLGPMIGASLLQFCGLLGPPLPASLLNLSQFMIGCYIGLLLQPAQLQRKARTITMALISSTVLIASAFLLSIVLTRLHPITAATAFLSMAPGGMDQMGIMAHEVGADLSVVSGYQTFRILFIYFVVSYGLRALFRYTKRRNAKKGS